MTRAAAALAWLGLVSACGGALSNVTVVANDVSIELVPGRASLPFDPHSARLVAAARQLSEVAGHPIAFRIDEALLPPGSRSGLDDTVSELVDSVAKDLRDLKRSRPELFAAEVPKLTRVELRYDPVVASERFDGAAVVAAQPANRWGQLGVDVSGALEDDYRVAQEQRYGAREPESVPPAEWRSYFDYVVHYGRKSWAIAVGRLTRLCALVAASDPALGGDIRGWLLDQGPSLSAIWTDHDSRMSAADRQDLEQARTTWTAWLNGALSSMTADEKLKVAHDVFETPYGCTDPVHPGFGGFDAFAFGLSIADAWIAAGHPMQGPDARFQLFDEILYMPTSVDPDGRLSRGMMGGCGGTWIRVALADDAQTHRLAAALAARNDAPLLTAVVYNARESIPLLRALEAYPRVWGAAVLQLIGAEYHPDEGGDVCSDALVDEANRMWRSTPALRGTALHVYACRHAYGYQPGTEAGDRDFVEFARLYGEPVSATVFGQFLDDGPGAMALVPWVWAALGKGWSRAAVIDQKLGAYLTDPAVRAGRGGEPEKTLEAIVARLCKDGSASEIARLHAALADRARADAVEGRLLGNVVVDTEPGRCRAK
ncbi:MAG TPA: hypothetical protein VF765_34535 [Polyangiaceae bacterium]